MPLADRDYMREPRRRRNRRRTWTGHAPYCDCPRCLERKKSLQSLFDTLPPVRRSPLSRLMARLKRGLFGFSAGR